MRAGLPARLVRFIKMRVTRKLIRIGAWSAAIVLAFPVVLSALYFVHGSLEMFPTEEQHAQARIAAAISFVFFAAIEALIGIALWRWKDR